MLATRYSAVHRFASSLGISVIAAVACLYALTGCANNYSATPSTATTTIGEKAPPFTLTNYDGKTISLSDLGGKTVVLEWICGTCPFVRDHYSPEKRTMIRLAEEFASEDVMWLAINSTAGHTPEQNKALAERWEVPYPILSDASGEVGRAYGAKTTPHVFVIDEEGVLVYAGAIDDNPLGEKDTTRPYVREALNAVVTGEPVATSQTKAYGCSVKYASAQ